jgi:hypothetical protein
MVVGSPIETLENAFLVNARNVKIDDPDGQRAVHHIFSTQSQNASRKTGLADVASLWRTCRRIVDQEETRNQFGLPIKPYFAAADIARGLCLSYYRVRYLRERGVLIGIRSSTGRVLYTEKDISRFVQSSGRLDDVSKSTCSRTKEDS